MNETRELDNVSRIVWKDCLRPKKGEAALIVADRSGESIAKSLEKTGKGFCRCELVFIKQTTRPGAEPDKGTASRMLEYDILVCPTRNSLTHTKAVGRARRRGTRVVTLPGITEDVYLRCVDVDYSRMKQETRNMADLLQGGDLTITTRKGTDIFIPLGRRRVIPSFGIPERGEVVNMPDGEAFAAPPEGRSEGVIVVDTAKRPFRIRVEKGEMADCSDKGVWKAHNVRNGRNLAELGIGTNPKARITGRVIEDEKVKGTAHIAFGTNKGFGGTVQSCIHIDYVFWKPTVERDGKVIIKEGRVV